MGNSDAAWSQLMADGADSLRREREAYAEAEHVHAQGLQEQIRELDMTVAEHTALKGALFAALRKAAADRDIPLSSVLPGKNNAEINASIIEIQNEGRRRFKAGIDYDSLRAQGLVYRPRGVS